jgi:phage tail sheath gpL-like
MVNFHKIPSNLREPLFYAELDASHANTAGPNLRALLIGQKLAAATRWRTRPLISRWPRRRPRPVRPGLAAGT